MFNYNTDAALWTASKYAGKTARIASGHVFIDRDCLARFSDTAEAVKTLTGEGWKVESQGEDSARLNAPAPSTNSNAEQSDIFERFGTYAKQFDALATRAAQRDLTAGERAFFRAFSDMLSGNGSEAQMREAHVNWMWENAATV